jgi:Transglycosylase-like domain
MYHAKHARRHPVAAAAFLATAGLVIAGPGAAFIGTPASAATITAHPGTGITASQYETRVLDISSARRIADTPSASAARTARTHAGHAIRSYDVHHGDTLTLIAERECRDASDWTGIYRASERVIGTNPDIIEPGQHLTISCHIADVVIPQPAPEHAQVTSDAHSQPSSAPASPAHASTDASSVSTDGMGSFQACVIRAESGGNPDIWNASGHWGLYQFSEETWVAYGGSAAEFGHASVAEQDQVFDNAMATPGGADNWAPYDGCGA